MSSHPASAAPAAPAARPACVALIAAVTRDGGIGRNNGLLVHLPQDLRHFRQVTMGCPVIMGRKTWDSLPAAFKPLPGRRNLVISRDPQADCPGAEVLAGLDEALLRLAAEPRVFVIGGAQIYALAMPVADELVLTEIDAQPQADAFFPLWDRQAFDEVKRIEPDGDCPSAPVRYAFVTYRRRSNPPERLPPR